jgi:hypothetical protein
MKYPRHIAERMMAIEDNVKHYMEPTSMGNGLRIHGGDAILQGYSNSTDYPSTLGAGRGISTVSSVIRQPMIHGTSRRGRPPMHPEVEGGKRNAFKEFTHNLGRSAKSIAIELSKPLGKSVKKVGEKAINVGEELAIKELEKQLASGGARRGRPRKTSIAMLDGGNSGGSKSGGKKMTLKSLEHSIVKIAKNPTVQKAVIAGLTGLGRQPKATLPKSGHKRETARGAIVAEVMKKHSLSLPQASKYVKEHGLY